MIFEGIANGYRSAMFSATGFFDFTKQGFERNQRQFKAISGAFENVTVLISGANTGLGFAAAKQIAGFGAAVHLLCRNKERGEKALEELKQLGLTTVHLHIVDVSSVSDVKRFVAEWAARADSKIDVLVNNAGILPAKRTETPDGLESTFATNTLGTYSLTTLLIPYLEKSQDPRVINVSSGGALTVKLAVTDVNYTAKPASSFEGSAVYAQTKRQQIELTEYWATKFPKTRFLSMHPGWADTPGVQTSIPEFRNFMKDRLRSSDQGADTIVWAALSQEARDMRNGAFLFDRKEVSQHLFLSGTRATAGDVEKLVEICERYIK
ncbi:UNVERIFIED_CONTAM: Dehydrogenase/reductase SDR member 12 [Siphonaria sp. JEL0065]|nr:Dehydrogenase/reductase SDR member 12 [Siphonaria sp. JEL0065]